jgi:hypothetical protein
MNKVPYIIAVTVILSVITFTFYTANKRIQTSGGDLISSMDQKQQYICFQHPYYGNVFYFKQVISDPRFTYLTGFSSFQGLRDGYLYGHLDKSKKVFSFSIVYNNNATNLFHFSAENMMGYTTSGYFHNNETRGNPEFVRFQQVQCPYIASEPKKVVDQSKDISITSTKSDKFAYLSTQCFRNLRHEDIFYFQSFSFGEIFVLEGNGFYRGNTNSIVHGIYNPYGQIYFFQINYPQYGRQRIFYFDSMDTVGPDYGVFPFFEDGYFDKPVIARYLSC